MSSSSSDSSSSSGSSSPNEEEGFAFNGQVYLTYHEMVAAKRERNRKVLQKSVDELSSALGSDKGSKRSGTNKKATTNKRKRRGSNPSASGSAQSSLRRNPGRAARRGTATSSISSQSHVSSSSKRIPIPPIPDGQTELREPCPQIGPGWIMRVRARKTVLFKHSPPVDRVFIAPTGRILRSMNDVDRFLDGESIITGNDTDANTSIGDASIFSMSQSRPNNDDTENPLQKMASTTSEAANALPALSSSAMPHQSLLPKFIMVKDMSATLEHVLLNGGRVQARESIWKDCISSDSVLGGDNDQYKTAHHTKEDNKKRKSNSDNKEEANANKEKERLIHLSDWKLYHPIISQSEHQFNKTGKHNNDDEKVKKGPSGFGSFGGDYDDDIEISEEFLVTNQANCKPETLPSNQQRQQQQHLKMLQETLPLNNPVKYNNIVRRRHSYYTSEGPDRHWDQEFGDGIDPMMFVEECCSGNAAAATGDDDIETIDNDCCNEGVPQRTSCERESGMASAIAKNYTSSLLQRCWDRAVHAASSTVSVSPAAGSQKGLKATLDATAVLQSQEVASSVLHCEAMNVVDSLLDVILANGNDPRLMSNNQQVDWRHVLSCLQAASRQGEKVEQKEIQVNENRLPIPLNEISLKSLSMRLVERYGAESHRMPL